ncbi:BRO1 domain [Macleaya cordata]|uniref:BRO1 domain n=1 Tax=Macleaya cordata TaxID=56857 RepID=A0A200Q444_MACCD|nr:BRO1 domain [Macleaya cordata]
MMLHFSDPAKLKTKKIIFEEIYMAPDPSTLEQFKELSSRRRVIEETMNETSFITKAIAREMAGGLTSRHDQELLKLELYLPLLENLVFHVDSVSNNTQIVRWTSELKIRWSSALSTFNLLNLTGNKFFRIDNLRFELGMTLFLYGAILRERASEVLLTGDLVQSSTLYRKAAGVYHHLAHEILPSLQFSFAQERPPEATSSISSIMSFICLAEAQAVTLRKAEEMGSTEGLLAKLHYGIKQLLDEAYGILHSNTRESKDVSQRLKEFVYFSRALHELRSKKYHADGLKVGDQIGLAIGVLRHALENVKGKMPGEESWQLVFRQETQSVGEMLRKLEHENDFVWHEKVPIDVYELPSLEGKKIVTAIPYHPQRLSASAIISEEKPIGSSFSRTDWFKLTYLEGNSWLWDVGGLKILVDPILVGNLDFGIPWLYDAAKKFLKNFQLSDLPEIDCLLITQSLDDHCHLKTLKPLSEMLPNLPVIATPNAEALLNPLFSNVTYLEPGQNSEIVGKNGSNVQVRATAGPVLGPPWQRPENGYLVTSQQGQLTLYYEPHCVYNQAFLQKEKADIVITPVIKQLLPSFTLVSGQEDAVQLAKLLQAKFIVPMKNGDLDAKGFLSSIVQAEGTMESFKELLLKEQPDAKVLELTPGVPLEIPTPSNINNS